MYQFQAVQQVFFTARINIEAPHETTSKQEDRLSSLKA
jgi:hypothetical protein